jgi:hypothetical protein
MRKILMASAASLGALLVTAGTAAAQPAKPVAPGTIAVHVNGYLQFEIADYGSTFNNVTVAGVGTSKLNPISTDGDARLYAGVDAATLSGIAYGAQIELRTQTSDAGVGAEKSSGSGGSTGSAGLYLKRAYGYVGTKDNGFIRLGQGDSAFTLLQTGAIEAFGDGAQFNTDGGAYSLLPTNAAPANFIYADASGLYATDKVVYISPTISGFGIAAGYEPNSNGLKEGYSTNAQASSTSAALSSSPVSTDIGKRRKNTFDAALIYTLKANGALTKASIGLIHANPIGYTGPAVALGNALHYGYDSLTVYEIGAQSTFAGLTVGANVKSGSTLDGYSFKPKGARDGLTYIIGATYTVGPYVIGASYYNGQTAGSFVPGSKLGHTLSEYGATVGGNYVVGTDLSLFLQYEYGHRHQFLNTALLNGKAQVQDIAAGATFKW